MFNFKKNESKTYLKWQKKYDVMYSKLYDNVIELYEEYCYLIHENNIEIKIIDITTELLMHPNIETVTIIDGKMEFHTTMTYPTISSFIPIKFMLVFLKYLDEEITSIKSHQ
jgi:hypothetical protein